MNNSKKLQIGVIGYAGVEEYPKEKAPKEEIYKAAERVGFYLRKRVQLLLRAEKAELWSPPPLELKKRTARQLAL